MKTPRKFYIVVSRTYPYGFAPSADSVHMTRLAALEDCQHRNYSAHGGVHDWRVETFVKGG